MLEHLSPSLYTHTNMNHPPIEDHENVILFSQPCPHASTLITPQGEKNQRRKRNKKMKKGVVEKGGSSFKKRKLTAEQVGLLEQNFRNDHKLETERKDRLALELGLDPRQIVVWFQNRRSRWKNKNLEQEYSNLKNDHQTTLLQKCYLQTQVLKLEEQLLEANQEIQRLLIESSGKAPSNSSSFSQSQSNMEAMTPPPFLGEFMLEEYEYDDGDVFYINPEIHYYFNGMEYWDNIPYV